MQIRRTLPIFLLLVVLGIILSVPAAAQSPRRPEPIANAALDRTELKWKPVIAYESLVLTVSQPNGEVFRQEFEAGSEPSFKLRDANGAALPDGQYVYELRLIPNLAPEVKEALRDGREGNNDAKVARQLRQSGKLPAEVIQFGSFLVSKGAVFIGSAESEKDAQLRQRISRGTGFRPPPLAPDAGRDSAFFTPAAYSPSNATLGAFDQVIPDDLIVQGSACVGLDCVNNENFGFDTIRLKENNLRIKFEDTSSAAGFPSNDWQLTANDSASGGLNKFSIDDITGARTPFTIEAGATTNSIYVDSTGRVGFRTSTPVLDLHANTSNTPSLRMEQNASGGFTAQTWDVGGNEANFFVRDVTSGSRLPFRIRPGAPTSSIDIAASGNVGIGTGSPAEELHVFKNANEALIAQVENPNNGLSSVAAMRTNAITAQLVFQSHADARTAVRFGQALGGRNELVQTAGTGLNVGTTNDTPLILGTNGANRVHIAGSGNIGLNNVTNPLSPIQHSSGATLSAGGMWLNASSRALKTNIRSLSSHDAFAALQRLQPVQFQYKAEPGQNHVGFIAEEVPALVAAGDRKTLSAMDVVAVLTKVVQEQQQTIAELKEKVERLEKTRVKKARLQKKR